MTDLDIVKLVGDIFARCVTKYELDYSMAGVDDFVVRSATDSFRAAEAFAEIARQRKESGGISGLNQPRK